MNAVVSRSQICSGMNKVNVEVGIVILFEIYREKILRCDSNLPNLKLVKKHLQHYFILRCNFFRFLLSTTLSGLAWELNLDFFGLEFDNVSVCSLLSDGGGVAALLDTQSEGDEIGGGGHEKNM